MSYLYDPSTNHDPILRAMPGGSRKVNTHRDIMDAFRIATLERQVKELMTAVDYLHKQMKETKSDIDRGIQHLK